MGRSAAAAAEKAGYSGKVTAADTHRHPNPEAKLSVSRSGMAIWASLARDSIIRVTRRTPIPFSFGRPSIMRKALVLDPELSDYAFTVLKAQGFHPCFGKRGASGDTIWLHAREYRRAVAFAN